jgi:hypothetical protein
MVHHQLVLCKLCAGLVENPNINSSHLLHVYKIPTMNSVPQLNANHESCPPIEGTMSCKHASCMNWSRLVERSNVHAVSTCTVMASAIQSAMSRPVRTMAAIAWLVKPTMLATGKLLHNAIVDQTFGRMLQVMKCSVPFSFC